MFLNLSYVAHAEAKDTKQTQADVSGANAVAGENGEKASSISNNNSNSEDDDQLSIKTKHPYWWMVKPCHIYREEYKDCTSIKERFNQYFIYGETQECSQWSQDYGNCKLWEQSRNEEALTKVIESERQRVRTRLRNHYMNDVWENREKPPEDWNSDLPESITRGYENSYLKQMRDELKRAEENSGAPASMFKKTTEESMCIVM